ncbi:MAG: hypothetical protein MJ139_05675, partial [Limosilactobacillus sp.]|nr:hypothetical protein [Limosilactobacillus sp.]
MPEITINMHLVLVSTIFGIFLFALSSRYGAQGSAAGGAHIGKGGDNGDYGHDKAKTCQRIGTHIANMAYVHSVHKAV